MIGTNMEYIEAYNKYLETHNLVETKQEFVNIGDTVVGIDTDMFTNFLFDAVAMEIVKTKVFNDPLDFLYGEDVGAGRIIKDIRTVLGDETNDYNIDDFEVDITNPFVKKKAPVMVVFHKVNEYKKAKVTTSYNQIMSAFGYSGGINDLINAWVRDLDTQFGAYWYNREKKALTDKNWLTEIRFNDYADFAVKVKDVAADFGSYDLSEGLNASLIPSPTADSDIVILMAKHYKNELDVNYFTGLFNQSFANIEGNIHYVDRFPDDDTVAVVFDKNGVQFHKQLQTKRTLENPADLTTNHWVHMWRMISVSPLYNAVVFKKNNTEVKRPTMSSPSGYYPSGVSLTLTQGEATNVKYSIDGKTPVAVTTSATINVENSQVIEVTYDGGSDIYRYRVD